jgi:hypothetical protein
MKPLILTLAIGVMALTLQAKTRPDSVYLCLGKYSHAYHSNTYCKGLRNCKARIIYVSLSDAINKFGRKSCGYCER